MLYQKIKYFLAQTAGSLWQFRTRNIFSVTIICLSFLIIGVFLSLANNLSATAGELAANISVTFFLDADLPQAATEALAAEMRRSPLVLGVDYVPAAEALTHFRESFPELRNVLESLKTNPFPPSLEARLKPEAATDEAAVQGFIASVRARPGVEDVQFNQDWIEKIRGLSRLARAAGLFLGGILVLASFFIISNIIKLNVFARRNEIEILRLVGGTNTFIRIPFLLEGMTLGFLGSLLSLLVLLVVIKLFPLYLGPTLGAVREIFEFRYLNLAQSLGLLTAGALIGLLGSLTSVSRFLKA